MADKKLVQLEYDKFLKKDSAYDVSPIAVVNPDGSNISGGGGSNATVTIVGSLPAGSNLIGGVTVYGNLSASLGGNVTLNTSPNFIGLVTTVPGAVTPVNDNSGSLTVDWTSGATVSIATMPSQTVTVGNVTLNTSPNQIGSVTVSNTVSMTGLVTTIPGVVTPVSDNSGSLTVDWVSGTTVAISNMPAITIGNVTLNTSNAYIGLVTVANIVSVDGSGFTQPVSFGLVSLASGTEVRSLATINNFPATYPVTDNGGSLTVDWVSGSTVAISTMPNITVGNVTLNTSPNQIGSVTVSNTVTVTGTVAATQSGTWDEVGINDSGNSITVDWTSGATVAISNIPSITIGAGNVTLNASNAFIGLVTVANSVPVTGTFWQTTQPVSFTGNATLNPSPNYIGLVTTVPGAVQPVNDNSGSLTVDWLSGATVGVSSLPNVTIGSNVTLNSSNAFIGLATVVLNSNVTLSPIQSLLSLASIYGNVGIATGANFIGLATVVPTYISTYTSLATVISASGSATLFVPPSNRRWILKDLLVGSQGQTQVGISSGTVTIIPTIALATMGGYISNFGDSGIRGRAQNDSFVVVNNSAVTISVTANVRFDS